MYLDGTQTVAEIARQNPASVPVFESFGIDYCCGGNRPLEAACASRNVPLDTVLSSLSKALAARPAENERHWMTARLTALADHIVGQHHEYAKRELPRLAALAAKVELRHGTLHPELHEIRELVAALGLEMIAHMQREEQVLFPRLKTIEDAAGEGITPLPAFFGSLIDPIRHMMNDHDDTGDVLKKLRTLTHDYQLHERACTSYQALYHGLESLEKDLHQHIHMENNILFPRTIEFEKFREEMR